jgi:hypothetical protein
MGLDVITLAAAKAYTDEKTANGGNGGNINLEGYAKLEDIPTPEEILQIVKNGLPLAEESEF